MNGGGRPSQVFLFDFFWLLLHTHVAHTGRTHEGAQQGRLFFSQSTSTQHTDTQTQHTVTQSVLLPAVAPHQLRVVAGLLVHVVVARRVLGARPCSQ